MKHSPLTHAPLHEPLRQIGRVLLRRRGVVLRPAFRPAFFVLALLGFTLAPAAFAALPVDHVVVLGDSFSDNGNFYAVAGYLQPPSYTRGRVTDGPDTAPASGISGVWDEQLAGALGLPVPTAYLANRGTNFAFTGAYTGTGTNSFGQNGMAVQTQEYLATQPANIGSALHLVWGGINDLLDASDPIGAGQTAVQNMSAQIDSIANAGGRYFVWLDMPPLDLTPRAQGNGGVKHAANVFGSQVLQAIASLQSAHPGITIVFVDVYSLYQDAIQNPGKYGLANVTGSAQGQPVNPDQYLFWDNLHPTTRMHQIIAGAVQGAVVSALTPPVQPPTAVSDDFSAASLNTNLWTQTGGGTVTVANGHALLSLPAGINHDAYVGGNNAVRMLQTVSNTDLDLAAKFDSALAGPWQGQGILVQQDANTYMRFEMYSDGAHYGLFAASIAGGNETPFIYSPLINNSTGPVWLHVQRTGNTWTLSTSTDGTNYTPAGSFNQQLAVSAVGPYAWTFSSYEPSAQAITSSVDGFYNLAAH